MSGRVARNRIARRSDGEIRQRRFFPAGHLCHSGAVPTVAGALKDWQPEYSDVQPDYGFIEETAAAYEKETAAVLEELLADNGYESEVKVSVKDGSLSDIDEITVILYLPVLSADEENRHIASVVGLVAERTSASADKVAVTVAEGEE